ncbi:MAG: hypothetical protein LBT90_01355 [Holosporaceae bacterium]|nr:hypothetical protein [Holosporaceae bacterium]
MSCYRKTTYKAEADDLVAAGYGYDFGDFKSYALPELSAASDDHKKFAKLFNSGRGQIIAARTCYDMNLTPKLSKQIKLLILTADDSPEIRNWQSKTAMAKICVCDAKRGHFLSISNSIKNIIPVYLESFISDKLFCIVTVFYGDAVHEEADISCCF